MVDKILEVEKRIPLLNSSSFVDNDNDYDNIKKEIIEDTIKRLEKDYVIMRRACKEAVEYPVTAAEYGNME